MPSLAAHGRSNRSAKSGKAGRGGPQLGAASPVRAVQRAFALLAALGEATPPATLSDLARRSDLAISTAARLLATLEGAGLVRHDRDGYVPGAALMRIALAALRGTDIYGIADAHLRRLTDATGETTNLVIRADDGHAIYVRQVLSPRSIHHAAWLGMLLPIGRTAAGAALSGRLESGGFAVRRDSIEPGVTAIAAPIYDSNDSVVAALSITGPSFRITDDDVTRFGLLAASEARNASLALGARRGLEVMGEKK